MLRSAMMAGVIALGCVGVSLPADAQMRGFHGGFSGGHFDGHHGFDHRGFGGDRFFFSFGFPGFGFGGYPYYPYYPAYYYPAYYYPAYYYPPYYSYPYYPPYPAYSSPGAYSGTVTPSARSAFDRATVREVQDELARRGYDVGPVDGRLGPRTKAAIREYERDAGLPVDGLPSPTLRDHMRSHPTG